MQSPLTTEQIQQLKTFDTCLIADAIESFGVRLRNEGFATTGFRCLFKSLPPLVGYAATCKVRSADPPIVGSRYVERTDWWKHIGSIPAPRVGISLREAYSFCRAERRSAWGLMAVALFVGRG